MHQHFPQHIPNCISFSPICFAQCYYIRTYIVGQILGSMFYVGSVQIYIGGVSKIPIFLCDGPIKETHLQKIIKIIKNNKK